jgi:glycosyltransferase involved in cell wall biosynthesis
MPLNRSTDSGDMRILVITTMFDHGGVTTYWRDLVAHLKGRCRLRFFVNLAHGVDPDPFKVSTVKVSTGFEWNRPFTASHNLIKEAKEFEPQTIIFNGTLAVLRLLPAIIFLRIMFRHATLKCVFHNGPIYQNWLKDFVNRIVVSGIACLFHQNIFVSSFVEDYWLCSGTVCSRPFDALPRDHYEIVGPLSIGFLGRISHEKDPELFLLVMEKVRARTAIHVELAGLGEMKPMLESRYSWADWRGWVSAREWLQNIDLLLTTSKTEGWPMALGEALECGVPIVGIDVGGVGEILRPIRHKWLIESRDIDELCKLVTTFLADYNKNSTEYFRAFTRDQASIDDWALQIVQ